MLKMLTSTIKAAASVVDVPVSVAADVVTMGGALTDKEKPYTAEAAARFVENVKNITEPEGDNQ